MELKKCFNEIENEIIGNEDVNILSLEHNSKKVTKGGLFFCIEGRTYNGVDYVYEAIHNGAVAVVVSKTNYERNKLFLDSHDELSIVIVDNVRNCIGYVCSNFYDYKNYKIKLIGITGTNGKTTTTMMIAHGLNSCGYSVGVIGTSGVFVNGDQLKGEDLTTPDPIDFYKILQFMESIYVDYVVCEISAHALDLCKINGLNFDYGIFTNLTEDHLDYFKTMEKYGEAKEKFFTFVKTKIINGQDEFGQYLISKQMANTISYGKINADYKIYYKYNKNIKIVHNNTKYIINSNLAGEYNAFNVCSAFIVLIGICPNRVKTIIKSFQSLPQISGRYNEFKTNNHGTVILDFAHTPDGLEKILLSVREKVGKGGKLISVFGCGGNRDRKKRPIMGEVSGKLSDYTFISIDNPRYEDANEVMADVEAGTAKVTTKYAVVMPRQEAIKRAIVMSNKNDFVVISGKGTEPYYEELGDKKPYREDIVIKSIIRKINKDRE